MSRGFRDADSTQRMTGREADEAIKRIQSASELQARHAADRREHGDHGVCESCGQTIGEERLAAVPEATRCITCQAVWEAGQANR